MLSAAIILLAAGNGQAEAAPAALCESVIVDESFVIDVGEDGQIGKREIAELVPCLQQYLDARTDPSVETCSYAESGNRFVINSDRTAKISGECLDRFKRAFESFADRVTEQFRAADDQRYRETELALERCGPGDFAAALECLDAHFDDEMKTGATSYGEAGWTHSRLAILAREGFNLFEDSRLFDSMTALGFKHPDDMSQAIIDAYHAELTGTAFDLQAAAEKSSHPAVPTAPWPVQTEQ